MKILFPPNSGFASLKRDGLAGWSTTPVNPGPNVALNLMSQPISRGRTGRRKKKNPPGFDAGQEYEEDTMLEGHHLSLLPSFQPSLSVCLAGNLTQTPGTPHLGLCMFIGLQEEEHHQSVITK